MMMKHAILIMAHKNVEHLYRLIGYFNRQCEVFVHVDKKGPSIVKKWRC